VILQIQNDGNDFLLDLDVQAKLIALAQLSGFDQPLGDRTERGRYIVEDAGGNIQLVDHDLVDPITLGPGQPELCNNPYRLGKGPELVQQGFTIIAQPHTHPVDGGIFPNPGGCFRYEDKNRDGQYDTRTERPGPTLEFKPGPSPPDLKLWRALMIDWPGVMLSPENVFVYRSDPNAFGRLAPGNPREYRLNDGADKCIP
jgi:hypothetical protein